MIPEGGGDKPSPPEISGSPARRGSQRREREEF